MRGEQVTCCICGTNHIKPGLFHYGGFNVIEGNGRWWCKDVRACRKAVMRLRGMNDHSG